MIDFIDKLTIYMTNLFKCHFAKIDHVIAYLLSIYGNWLREWIQSSDVLMEWTSTTLIFFITDVILLKRLSYNY
ncbi:predicted protein [Histoplasma mississippiense (nom. inval.)]|uniref:predicted protein n=1 Tax=Ajellomyces capsulatus (strain NAm1 / WU24) TaxID=2059318 RepID=UPI000157B85A|nr:predicted protein [Histoplasma mississippiense (nom. inval.)]EDN03947.1 predicted protein [Histoplasma mississippiense (nom. inval.)]